jgi:hypothetical protein
LDLNRWLFSLNTCFFYGEITPIIFLELGSIELPNFLKNLARKLMMRLDSWSL